MAQSERAILRHIRNGADNEEAIAERCGAGTDCGGCMPMLRWLLDQELGARSPVIST